MTPVNDGILTDIAQAVTVSPVSTDIVYAVLPVAPDFFAVHCIGSKSQTGSVYVPLMLNTLVSDRCIKS